MLDNDRPNDGLGPGSGASIVFAEIPGVDFRQLFPRDNIGKSNPAILGIQTRFEWGLEFLDGNLVEIGLFDHDQSARLFRLFANMIFINIAIVKD